MKNHYLIFIFFLFVTIPLHSQLQKDTLTSTYITSDSEINNEAKEKEPLALIWSKTNQLVNKKEISFRSNIDATRLMQSKIAGLNILANSYTPGASSRINYRGYRSINNTNEPLILLNGIPLNNAELLNGSSGTDQSNRLIDLDPHFIEDIEFIGNAAGRARYGIVGSNGIISITTKNANSKKLKVSFNSSVMRGNVSQMPSLQNSRAQGRITNGEAFYLGPETSNAFSWGPPVNELYYDNSILNLYDKNGSITSDVTNTPINTYDPYDFFINSWRQNYSLSLSKATKIFSGTVVGGYTNDTGVIPTNQFRRYNVGVNLGIRPLKNLSLAVNGAFSSSTTNRTIKGASLNGIMLGLLRTSPTFDNSNGLADPLIDNTSYLLDNGIQRSYRTGIYDNPYRSVNETSNIDIVSRRIIQLSGKYILSKKWSVLFNSGIDNYTDLREGGLNIDISPFTPFQGSAYRRTFDYSASHLGISSLYDFLSTDLLNLDFTVGYEYNQSSFSSDFIEGEKLLNEGILEIENAQEIDVFNSFNDFKRAGGIFAIDFNYGRLLEVNSSLRHDYSNKFGSSTNGFTSWGLEAAVNLVQILDSLSNPHFNIALTSSVGKSGNTEVLGDNIGLYIPSNIGGDPFISSFSVNGYEPNDIGRSDFLTAESTLAFDAGISMKYKNLVTYNITLYSEQSTGLHLRQAISSTSGLNFQTVNIGSITNRGLDISLQLNPVQSRKVNWSFDVHFNKNINEVNSLNEYDNSISFGPFLQTSSIAQEGQAYGVIRGSAFERNDAGDLIIGGNGWPLVSSSNQIIGDPNPDWMVFLGNSITLFETIRLSALIEVKQGGDMYCGTCGTLDYFGRTEKAVNEIDRTFLFEGVTETGEVNTQEVELAPTTGNYNDFYRVRYGFGGLTEMSIYDASWIKLRNLSLTYDFSNLLNFEDGRSIILGFTMENFILRTSYPGVDPETNLTGSSGGLGIDYYNNPGIKRYGVNLKLNF